MLCACVAVLLSAGPRPASATEGEGELTPYVGVLTQTDGAYAGGRIGGEAMWSISDFWALGGALLWTGGGYAGGDGSLAWFGTATARARLTIDALTWVPALFVAAGVGALPGDAWVQVGAGGELAYRRRREGAFFGRLVFEGPALRAGNFAGLELGYRFICGPTADLDF